MEAIVDMVEFLLQNGADINQRTKHDYTLIRLAIWYSKLHLVEVFAQNGANVNQILPDGTIALHIVLRWAINGNKKETVCILLENGGNIDIRDAYGFTLLHYSIMEENERMCESLLEFGADLDALNYWIYSLFELAIKIENRQIVQLLLKYGICLDVRNDDGNNLLEYCLEKKEKKRFDVFKMITFHGLNKFLLKSLIIEII